MCSLHIYYRSRFSIKFEFFLSYYIEIKEKYLNMTKSSTIPLHHRTKFTIVQTKLFHPIYNIKPNSGEYQTVNYDLTIAIWTDKSTARKTTHVSKAKTTHISRPEYIRNKTSAPFWLIWTLTVIRAPALSITPKRRKNKTKFEPLLGSIIEIRTVAMADN